MHRNNSVDPQTSRRIRRLTPWLAPAAALAAVAGGVWLWAPPTSVAPAAGQPVAHAPRQPDSNAPTATGAQALAAPVAAATAEASAAAVVNVKVGKNDTLDGIFRRMSLDMADLAAIRNLPGIRQSLDTLKPGDTIQLTHTDGQLNELSRKISETQTLRLVRQNDGFVTNMQNNPVETRVRTATAIIYSSLFQAAEAADISDTVALKLANVFAWDIDFVLDIREGDRFTAEYEQIYQDGKYVRDGQVLAAEFVNNGKVYRAVRFAMHGHGAGYYTPDGRPMRKAFLRAPVDFTRVSSAFNPHRHHPILNIIRGHMGTDYAAPTGTPVHAAGDGRVCFEGKRGGYGNAVMIAHGGNVSTLYGHMSRFARNVRLGTHVEQGEVIGYVGMTGLATGPHLHYEYLVNGVHKNPQTVQLPGAEPLRAEALQSFRDAAAPLLADLAQPVNPSAGTAAPSIPPASAAATGFPTAGFSVGSLHGDARSKLSPN